MMERIKIDNAISSTLSPVQEKKKSGDFAGRLKTAVGEVNELQLSADRATEKVTDGSMGIHEGMIALSKADISLRLLIQVRNKVMEAYREISRMSF